MSDVCLLQRRQCLIWHIPDERSACPGHKRGMMREMGLAGAPLFHLLEGHCRARLTRKSRLGDPLARGRRTFAIQRNFAAVSLRSSAGSDCDGQFHAPKMRNPPVATLIGREVVGSPEKWWELAEREGLPLAMPECAARFFFQISLQAKDAFKPMALWVGFSSRPIKPTPQTR